MKSPMDTSERYRELLDAFRDAHSKLKATPFALNVCHWAEAPRITRGEPWNTYLKNCVLVLDKSPGEVLPVGLLAFPVIDPNWLTYAILASPLSDERIARDCGDEIMHMTWRTCVIYAKTHGEKQRKAAVEFVRLADKAGQELPLSMRETIPHQANVVDGEPSEFANRWLALMYWSDPPELDELVRLNQWGGGQILFWQPFSNAADVIERCRLTTDSVAFHTKGGHWPLWCGAIPESLRLPQQKATTETDARRQAAESRKGPDSAATSKQKRSNTKGKAKKPRKVSKVGIFVEQAVRNYHKFDGGIVDQTIPPISGRDLAEQSKAFSSRSADRWFVDRFGSKEAYETACFNGTLGRRLAVKEDDVRAFGTFDHSENEVGDDQDEDDEHEDEPNKAKHGKKRPGIAQRF